MRIKTKITLGIGLLFTLIVVLVSISTYYLDALSNATKKILEANYNSLEYTQNMVAALERTEDREQSLAVFEKNLIKQQNNITEIGEAELTQKLGERFAQLKANQKDTAIYHKLRIDNYAIMKLNMDAIARKSAVATQTAKTATMWVAISGVLCFLISFTLLLNFPARISTPIQELTESIRQIADKNYRKRLHFQGKDEFNDLADSFNTMAEKLDRYEQSNLAKIIFEKKRIETIINNMKYPIIGFDEKRYILFANTEATKILNIESAKLIGNYAPDIALHNDLLRRLLTIENTQAPLKIYSDGKESYFTKEVVQIVADLQPIGEVILLNNITEYKELDLAKTNFIATISHELKTPISSIKLSLKLLEDARVGTVNPEQQKLIETMKDESQRLLKITGELLDLAQVETGNIQLQKQSTMPETIISYACNALAFQAQQKNIHLEVICEEELPNVVCDIEKTAWVLVNFFSNAVRYSPEDAKINIRCYRIAGVVSPEVQFTVQDYGRGIDPKYQPKIFEKFYQVPNSDTTNTGTGLGLAISKEFIEAQGGSIGLVSEVGMGSTFMFTLPAVA
ncbi:MAG: HAMP domain-containing protein [Ignavibacteria bacterium]|nr:HAMP domain-containing protein [Ignavibacteria bacterium]